MADTLTTPPTSAAPLSAARSPWRLAALIVGDALSFLVFAGVGRNTHGEVSGLAALGQVALTALPFALGWFAVSPWLGAFRRSTTESVRRMLTRTELAWLASYPVAVALRVLFDPQHRMPVSFAIVILLANAVFLGVWRVAFALVARTLSRRGAQV